ncbi:MAG: hypothetical protein ACYTGC_11805 [Planctomycetota bacterium]|jgi:hypothetical protein
MRVDQALPFHIARAYGVSQPVAASPATPPAKLVAASVREPAALPAQDLARTEGVLPMYTRAADLVEAAVAVQLGRSVDLTG